MKQRRGDPFDESIEIIDKRLNDNVIERNV